MMYNNNDPPEFPKNISAVQKSSLPQDWNVTTMSCQLDGLVDDSTEVSDSAASATLDHCLFSMVFRGGLPAMEGDPIWFN